MRAKIRLWRVLFVLAASVFATSGAHAQSMDVIDATNGCSLVSPMLWLRADSGVTASCNRVSQWSDQSGHGFHATMASASRQPTLVAGAINGLPVVRFGGAQSLYLTSAIQPTAFTIFVVGKNSQPGESYSMILGPGGNSPNNQVRWENSQQVLLVGIGNDLPVTTSSIGNTRVNHLLALRYDGATLEVSRNGALVSTHSFTTTGPFTLAQVGGWFSSYYLIGDLAEIVVYDTALSDFGFESATSRLKSKYAL